MLLALLIHQADADALADLPNLWVQRKVVEGAEPALTVAEQAVQQLYRSLVGLQLAPPPGSWQGVEYWCQVYEGGRGLGFHFDKDEQAMAADGRMVNPTLSSVLYLTGSQEDSPRQVGGLQHSINSSSTVWTKAWAGLNIRTFTKSIKLTLIICFEHKGGEPVLCVCCHVAGARCYQSAWGEHAALRQADPAAAATANSAAPDRHTSPPAGSHRAH